MKHARPIQMLVLVATASFAGTGAAGLFDTQDYDQCVIDHLSGVKLDLVATEMIRICDETYKSNRLVSKKQQAYNACLLEYLPSVESPIAAKEIIRACRRRHLEKL